MDAAPYESAAVAANGPSIRDSFRWLDDDDDDGLDLRLFLGDYDDVVLRETAPLFPPARPSKPRRPASGHLSLMRLRFTREVASAAPSSSSSSSSPVAAAAATHYQDPDARLKLRAHLASPQKFDEAIAFGFPPRDTLASRAGTLLPAPPGSRKLLSDDVQLRIFLAESESDDDDQPSLSSDQGSPVEPESPKTPQDNEAPTGPGCYSEREMTLRMTMTRPDLRDGEDQMYGWQHARPHGLRLSYIRDARRSLGADLHSCGLGHHWQAAGAGVGAGDGVAEFGVMSRMWNRVKKP